MGNPTTFTNFRILPLVRVASKTLAHKDSGLIVINLAATLTVTLPAATGSGTLFRFFNQIDATGDKVIQVANSSDVMNGNITTNSTGDTPDLAQPWPTAATSDTITLNGSTKGGVGGDWIELVDVLANVWSVQGFTRTSGTEATPFSAAV